MDSRKKSVQGFTPNVDADVTDGGVGEDNSALISGIAGADLVGLNGTPHPKSIVSKLPQDPDAFTQSLLLNEERLRMAMNAAKIGTFDWNMLTGQVHWSANLENYMGLPSGSFEGTIEAFGRQVHPDDRETVQQAIQHSVKTGADYNVEFRMIRMDGTIRWVQAKGKLLLDDDGAPARLIGIDVDITEQKLFRQRLSAAEQKYADFYDHAPDLLFSVDADSGRIQECNQTACDTLGYTKDEIIGRQTFEICHPDSQETSRRTFQEFLRTGFVSNVELEFCRKDGTTIEVSLSASAVRDGDRIVASRSICRNIAELKQAARALRQSESEARARAEELTAVLDAIPTMTFIARDPSCQNITSSRAAHDILRVPYGGNTSASAPPDQRPTHFQIIRDGRVLSPEELPVQQAALQGQAVRDVELRIAFDDGSARDAFGHAVPLLDEQGKVRGAVGAFVDITERKKVEERLKNSEMRLRRFVDANVIGICSSRLDGSIFEANDVFLSMLGYSREEFLAGNFDWKKITPPEFLALGQHAVEELKTKGVFAPFEKEYLRKDGTRVPVLIGAATTHQSPLEWMCFVLDITERKRFEELKARDKVQQQMLEHEILAREEERRAIARELHDESGQMMASLLAGLRLIEQAKNLKEAKSQAHDLRKVASLAIDELGRLSRGLHPLALDDLGLEVALRHYADEYQRLHGITVKITMVGLGTKRLSKSMEVGLYRIVQEALTNISKHSQAKTASITLRVHRKFLELTIADDGKGFDADRTLGDNSGRHMGLHGMRERAAMLGGEFLVFSQQGGGTMKTLRFPVTFGNS